AELILIIIIMLIVAGPQRMIRWAYHIGQYIGKFRILWEQMVDVLQDEVDAAGLDVKLPKDIPTRATIAKTANDLIKPYAESLEKTADEIKKPLQETLNETTTAVQDAKKAGEDALDQADKAIKEPKKPTFKAADGAVRADQASEPISTPESSPSDLGAWTKTTAQATPDKEPQSSNDFGAWTQSTTNNQAPNQEA
ncbi:MAG: hypothetical protein AAFV93_06850, partial [Chloroflexota bacterium]